MTNPNTPLAPMPSVEEIKELCNKLSCMAVEASHHIGADSENKAVRTLCVEAVMALSPIAAHMSRAEPTAYVVYARDPVRESMPYWITATWTEADSKRCAELGIEWAPLFTFPQATP